MGAAFQPRIKTIAAGKPLPQHPILLFFSDNRISKYELNLATIGALDYTAFYS
jgi:hypothetical protein